jgi:hypothetical protein
MEKEEAEKRLNNYLTMHYHKTIDDVVISSVRGYWKDKELCDITTCGSPLHGFMGCSSAVKHTYHFREYDLRNKKGQIISPFRVWDTLNGKTMIEKGESQCRKINQ